jgi:hypothetical protein
VTFLPKVSDVKVEITEEMYTEFWKEILKEEDQFVNLGVELRTKLKHRELD